MTQRGTDDVRALEGEAIMLCLSGLFHFQYQPRFSGQAWDLAKNNSRAVDDEEYFTFLSNVVEQPRLDE